MKVIVARAINSLIWIVCGALVIVIRAVILPTGSVQVWELLGGGLIAYGAAKLVWFIARR
jgi:hypothetical protein